MASKRVAIPYKDIMMRIIGPKQDFYASRVQRLDIPTNLPSTTVNELGNSRHAGTITDIPEVSCTFQAMDVSHKIYSYLTGTNPASYPAAGVDVSNLGNIDIGVYIKDESTTDIVKSIHARKLQITGFTYTYSVDAESTEEYSAEGTEKRYLRNDLYVEYAGICPSGVGATFTLDYTPKQLKNGNYLISLIQDGLWKVEDEDYSVVGTTVTISGACVSGIIAVYHSDSYTDMTWTDQVRDSTIPAAIRGKNVPIRIATNQMDRVQSVTIRGTFPNTRIEEMGNINIVGYIVDPPDITGDLTVLDTDFEIIALLCEGSISDTDTEYNVTEYEERTLALRVELLDPADNTTVLKTIRIPGMRITSEGTTGNVGGQVTQTFGFVSDDAQCVVYSGAYGG